MSYKECISGIRCHGFMIVINVIVVVVVEHEWLQHDRLKVKACLSSASYQ